MKKLVLIAFLLIGMMGQAQIKQKQQKRYDYSIEHYQHLKKKSLKRSIIGGVFVGTGIGIFAYSAANNPISGGWVPFIGFFTGQILFHIGMPIMISNSIAARANGKAVRAKRSDINLSLGVTNNGIGLVLKF